MLTPPQSDLNTLTKGLNEIELIKLEQKKLEL